MNVFHASDRWPHVGKPLAVGARIPAFEAPDAHAHVWRSEHLLGAPFVLYFYPQDETPGCILEACAFRDAWGDFQAIGVRVLGVSRDGIDAHRRFVEHRRLPFPLLSDGGGSMHEGYGATMLGGLPRRVSYLVDADGHVAAVFDSHLRPEAHAERMLAAAERLALTRRTSR
jgi:peroxiredoxin Q/BCP